MLEHDPAATNQRILLVDDIPSVREALRWVLESESGMEVVGEAGDGLAALVETRRLRPDVVIVDLMLPLLDGLSVIRRLKLESAPPHVVVLSVHGGTVARRRAADAGADGFVEKSNGWAPLIALLRALPLGSALLHRAADQSPSGVTSTPCEATHT